MEENEEFYNLTNPQKSIWLTEQHYSNTNVGNIVGALEFRQHIDIEKLKSAVNIVVKNNDALRIGFLMVDGEMQQYIKEYEKFDIETLEIINFEEYMKDFSNIRFDIQNEMLYHFEILKLKNNKLKLITRLHHMVTDAWSLSLIISEIVETYTKLENNNEEICNEYYSYKNYIKDEKEYIVSDKYFQDQNYWNNIYNTEPQILNFNKEQYKNIAEANRIEYKLNRNTSNLIQIFCKNNNITPYCLFLTALQVYISKNFNIEDVIIGNPFLNRKNHKERESIGMYVNTLPLRLNTNYDSTIIDLLKTNNTLIRNALRHEQYPNNDILQYVKDKYNINQNLYNILFSYQNAQDNRKISEIQYSTQWIFNNNIADNLELHIHDRDDNGTFNIVYDYQKNVFTENQIKNLNIKYTNIIKQIINNKIEKVNEIQIITKKEKYKILNIYNNTCRRFEKEYKLQNVYNVIINNNKHNLENIALEDSNEKITYGELIQRVNKLANYLEKKYDIQEKQNIGIVADKGIDTIIGILAILKINCTIVPIDPSYPNQRKEYMVSNAEIKTILYTKSLAGLIAENIININYENYENEQEDKNMYDYNINNNLYIVYTSGSTGNPKPVTISHKNIINLIMHEIKTRDITFQNSKILQFATLSFDVSYQEIFTALFTGSTLVIIQDETKKDNIKLAQYIIDKKIDILFIPPRYLIYLSDSEKINKLTSTLKHIITAGEQLIITDNIKMMIENGVILHNHYGPAETHVATTYTITKQNISLKPPIGKPISNSKIYILDKQHCLLPIGATGEIYISGECVGNGYFNKRNLTQERFIKDPFCSKYIMYKTGDLGKFDDFGNIYYLGRTDFQVKVNGYRIEMEEVEKQISSIPEIENATVAIEKDNLDKNKLVAYIELKSKISYEDFKDKLSKKLPKYMIPSKIYLIEKMPLNINGKADKKLLEANKEQYKIFTSTDKDAIPENEIEAKILKCMQNVLNTKGINVQNDFFEIGGDSLSAIALQVELAKENIILNTQEIYDNPTAKGLYKYLNSKKESNNTDECKKIILKQEKVNIKSNNNILLTGATGFLGIHILNNLLENTNNIIYCIIRRKDNIEPTERLNKKYKYYFGKDISSIKNRIVILTGDLITEKFDMKLEKYNDLLRKIDIVINVAASVKHYGKRDYNYEHNVVSTKNILEFVEKSGALLNHISTIGLAGNNLVNTNNCIKDTFSETDLIIGQDFNDNVYISTKLQAEQLIINEIQNGLIKANILRVGNLMNRYCDNVFQENKESNAFQNKIQEIIKLGYLPKSMKDFSFDITPVDLCAKAITKLIFYNYYNNIFHVLNNKELSIKDIEKILKNLNITIQEVDSIKQQDKIKSKWLVNDFTLNNKRKIKIDSQKTLAVLNSLDFNWKNDTEYYNKVFKSIVEGIKDEENI